LVDHVFGVAVGSNALTPALSFVMNTSGACRSRTTQSWASCADCVDELRVVVLVLIDAAVGEAGDRLVERVAVAQVDGDRVPGPGVRPGQRPSAGRGRGT